MFLTAEFINSYSGRKNRKIMYFIGYQIKLPTKRVSDIYFLVSETNNEGAEAFKGVLFYILPGITTHPKYITYVHNTHEHKMSMYITHHGRTPLTVESNIQIKTTFKQQKYERLNLFSKKNLFNSCMKFLCNQECYAIQCICRLHSDITLKCDLDP